MKQKNVSRHFRAVKRNTVWASFTPAEQLSALELKFPDGAKKQKERLKKRLNQESLAE